MTAAGKKASEGDASPTPGQPDRQGAGTRSKRPPPPVLPFLGLLLSRGLDPKAIENRVRETFLLGGLVAPLRPFDATAYYRAEMGEGLRRFFVAAEAPVHPDLMGSYKDRARRLEAAYSRNGARRLNLDPGYLDLFKVILMSEKYGGGKIYIGGGYYADVVLNWHHGAWHPPDRTFPDFRDDRYFPYFSELRDRYRAWLRGRPQP